MKVSKVTVDPRGRILIPREFLDGLCIKENQNLYLLLDEDHKSIRITNFEAHDIYEILITMNDKPGTVAWISTVLYEHHFNIIFIEAHSIATKKNALWRSVGTFKGKCDLSQLKKELLKNGATSVSMVKL